MTRFVRQLSAFVFIKLRDHEEEKTVSAFRRTRAKEAENVRMLVRFVLYGSTRSVCMQFGVDLLLRTNMRLKLLNAL